MTPTSAHQEVNDMTAPLPVVVGVDGSDGSMTAFRVAVREAYHRDAPLIVVHAWLLSAPGLPLDVPARLDDATEERLRVLLRVHVEDLLATEKHGDVDVDVTYGWGGRVLTARSDAAQLVVVGSRGLGAVRGALVGSVSNYVLEHATCPVMVVHQLLTEGPRRVVVGVDGSDASLAALRWANDYAVRASLPLLAVHAGGAAVSAILHPGLATAHHGDGWNRDGTRQLEQWLATTLGAERAGVVGSLVDSSPVTRFVLDLVHTDDLVVIGRQGTGGFAGLHLGSVARRLAAQVPGAVVVVGTTVVSVEAEDLVGTSGDVNT